MIRRPPISTRTDTLFPYTTLFRSRIAADTAVFAESFVKLGLVPGDGGAWLLPRVIGMARASLMTLTGETIDAARALDMGWLPRWVRATGLSGGAWKGPGRSAPTPEVGRAHVLTSGHYWPPVCRRLLGKKKKRKTNSTTNHKYI